MTMLNHTTLLLQGSDGVVGCWQPLYRIGAISLALIDFNLALVLVQEMIESEMVLVQLLCCWAGTSYRFSVLDS